MQRIGGLTKRAKMLGCGVVLAVLVGCGEGGFMGNAADSGEFKPSVARWDHLPSGDVWTETTLNALQTHGAVLPKTIPADIHQWCPAYAENSESQRAQFWVGLMSALAKWESTWNPKAVGGGGRWFGLVQIAPATARGYGCDAKSGEALKNGSANLSCAIRIWAETVPRDGVVAAKENGRRGGVAADWGPFSSASRTADMRKWTSRQSYCE
ncbi:transglycosylase SLT domain-containing protein [Halocynthiibacter sp. SDUM655004]|uniref:Transglycosylase SLT domain-containing protein n=2 Tax=Paracoccaceae TaxID=31989 RepID=A0AAE3J112_9RHOB|nr:MULTISPECIES: transglycosylase SLT domain-containing protein [Halocynthiibacter]MCV6824735.1 transglycosylase SLT domain-containing protein [Halocynthiibacter halioticoli]MCW4057736.1 transglycosylase SLT domain-containing protein [Halocynthiibacter sp. SDUM655004]